MTFSTGIADQFAPLIDQHEYPRRWTEYVGQEQAKRQLQVAVKAAKVRRKPLDHVLIAHPSPGVGKTALANLVAMAMGKPCRVITGPMHVSKARLLFSDMNDGEVLLWDEIHKVMDNGKKNAEWLLDYLQGYTLPGPLRSEIQPKVTIVGATTDAGKLPEAIVGRFANQPTMVEYSLEEATKIAQVMSKRILGEVDLPVVNKKAGEQIAAAASHNPRAIRRLLVVLRDMTITDEIAMKGSTYDVPALLEWQGVTPDGLDHTAQKYLTTLAMEFAGNAGAKSLEDRLSQAGGLVHTERLLMDKGLVAKTRSGRMLTQAGNARVRELVS